MANQEGRLRILRMVEEGQISADEGVRLLEALGDVDQPDAESPAQPAPRWFHVRVTDLRSGRRKVDINIPVGLVDVGIKMGARFAPGGGVDLSMVQQFVESGRTGQVLDYEDHDEGERIEIFVE